MMNHEYILDLLVELVERANKGPFILIEGGSFDKLSGVLSSHPNCRQSAEQDLEYNYASEAAESWLSSCEADRFIIL